MTASAPSIQAILDALWASCAFLALGTGGIHAARFPPGRSSNLTKEVQRV